ncbi:MAG: hypothetical protein QNL91_03690 [Candidatus Krumholzibacteria bacterium]|nr:hypothetical protein [Candidatus Krumholzibacteria bacterium]
MKNTFVCPHCQGVLNPNVKILLVADTKKDRGLILLSPQPGNYKYLCDKSLHEALSPSGAVELSCPLCNKSLTAPDNKKMAQLELHVTGHKVRQVRFSRVFGTQATFIIDGDDVTSFGEDADDIGSTNFFGS